MGKIREESPRSFTKETTNLSKLKKGESNNFKNVRK